MERSSSRRKWSQIYTLGQISAISAKKVNQFHGLRNVWLCSLDQTLSAWHICKITWRYTFNGKFENERYSVFICGETGFCHLLESWPVFAIAFESKPRTLVLITCYRCRIGFITNEWRTDREQFWPHGCNRCYWFMCEKITKSEFRLNLRFLHNVRLLELILLLPSCDRSKAHFPRYSC